jgi:hypothetical protein
MTPLELPPRRAEAAARPFWRTAPDGSEDEIVFDLTVGDGEQGWASYRADRLASLYGTGSPAG